MSGTGPKVYELVAQTLSHLGHEVIFGLLGSGNFLLTEQFVRRYGGRHVWVRHESAAVAAAATYAQVTGRLGLASVHQGPGVTNTLTTLTHAVRERSPVLLLAGETGTGRQVNQTIDLASVVEPTGAHVERLTDPGHAVSVIAQAAEHAVRERSPVVVGLPVDVQEKVGTWVPPLSTRPRLAAVQPAQVSVEEIADLIAHSSRPVILGGRGAVLARARSPLERLGERIGAVFATTLVANGLFSGHPRSLGVCGGFSSELAAEVIGEADLVLSFGASINQWTAMHGALITGDTLVHCDTDPAVIGSYLTPAAGLVGDAGLSALALLDALEARSLTGDGSWAAEAERRIASYLPIDDFEEQSTGDQLDPRAAAAVLDRLVPAERTITYDSGHFHWFPTPYLSVPDPAGFVSAQGFQSVGIGLGVALGAAIARPDRPVLLFIGDGGTMMQLGELDALVAQDARVVVAIYNDGAYGAEVHHFEPMGHSPELVRFGDRDFAAVARALGAAAATVRSADDLETSMTPWLAHGEGPLVLDIKVNPEVRSERLQEAFHRA